MRSRRGNYIIPHPAAKSQKILPPNFQSAAACRHLARDCACGENWFAPSVRSQTSQSPPRRTTRSSLANESTADLVREPGHADRASIRQMANPADLRGLGRQRLRIHLCARRRLDAFTVFSSPRQIPILVTRFLASSITWPKYRHNLDERRQASQFSTTRVARDVNRKNALFGKDGHRPICIPFVSRIRSERCLRRK